MAKKQDRLQTDDSLESVSFENAIAGLEQIVRDLEDGQLGLDDSLEQYENGMKYLRRCYQLLETAERKIELLQHVDEDGRAVTESFDEVSEPVEAKAKSRSRRRTGRSRGEDGPPEKKVASNAESKSEDSEDANDNNIDLPGALF